MVRKLLPLAAAFAVCGAAAASAQAITVSVGAPSLSGRVAVTTPVTVSCTPFDPSLTLVSETINITVEQASGRSIAHAVGGTSAFFGSPLPFPCDGTQATIPVTSTADPSGPPFHGGSAVVTASAFAQAGIPCGVFPGCFQILASQTGSSAPTTVHLH